MTISTSKMYYHGVYLDVFETVLSVYGHLLAKNEMELIEKIVQLNNSYQLLLFRLLNRTRNWIRSDRLEYEEIDFSNIDLQNPPDGIFEVDPADQCAWIEVLRLDELRSLSIKLGFCSSAESKKKSSTDLVELVQSSKPRKQARINFDGGVMASCSRDIDVILMVKSTFNFSLIRVNDVLFDLHDQVVLPLYFINSHDPVEELRGAFLAKVDRRRYPSYHVIRSGSIFKTRDEFDSYQEALLYSQSLEAIPDPQSLVETSKDLMESFNLHMCSDSSYRSYYLQRFTVLWAFAKSLEYLASSLETSKEYSKAVEVYSCLLQQEKVCLGRRGDWWERLILDSHKHLKISLDSVQELCEKALEDVHVRAGSRWSIERRLTKLLDTEDAKQDFLDRLIIDVIEKSPAKPSNPKRGQSVLYFLDEKEDVVVGVEDLAIRYYQSEGWDGVHSESGFFTMLFALIFWDILFSSVPDVFQTPYQTFPLDLRTDAFYEFRKDVIEERLSAIEMGTFDGNKVKNLFLIHEGTYCIGVNWEKYSVNFFVDVFEGLGGKACSVIMRALAMDYRNYSSGMPDLVLWRNGDVMLVEVKSENDKLSDQQRNWLSLLLASSVHVRLCKISSKKNK